MTLCEFESCGRPKYANGLCATHRAMQRKGTPLRPLSNSWANKSDPPEVRFWAKVSRGGEDDCWLWKGGVGKNGYGHFVGGVGYMSAHRYSFKIHKGLIPEGLVIDHMCLTKACVNPRHLRAVTQKQNTENHHGKARTRARGVSWVAKLGKWRAAVRHNGKYYSLGYYFEWEDARDAAIAKRNELYTHNDSDK